MEVKVKKVRYTTNLNDTGEFNGNYEDAQLGKHLMDGTHKRR